MSAYVVSKTHIDLMVRAADHYGRREIDGMGFRWWRVDENGDFAGWHELDELAEVAPSRHDPEYLVKIMPSAAGQILVNENIRSVSGQYPDADPDVGDLPGPCDAYYMGPYVYEDPGRVLTPAEVFKAIDNYDYQSCESDDWRRTEAFAFCESLRRTACRALDGYAAAPWGFERTEATR